MFGISSKDALHDLQGNMARCLEFACCKPLWQLTWQCADARVCEFIMAGRMVHILLTRTKYIGQYNSDYIV